jgi:hypothetical protein
MAAIPPSQVGGAREVVEGMEGRLRALKQHLHNLSLAARRGEAAADAATQLAVRLEAESRDLQRRSQGLESTVRV